VHILPSVVLCVGNMFELEYFFVEEVRILSVMLYAICNMRNFERCQYLNEINKLHF
jgi:hypothetical protein